MQREARGTSAKQIGVVAASTALLIVLWFVFGQRLGLADGSVVVPTSLIVAGVAVSLMLLASKRKK